MHRVRASEHRGRGVRPRLVVTDVDGTLLTSRHEVTSAAVDAVRRVRDSGVDVVLATSRPPLALLPILARLNLLEPAVFIGSQGAITGSFTAEGRLRVVERHPMPLDLARVAVAAAVDAGLAVSWYSGEEWLVSHLDDEVRREARVVGFEPTVADLDAQSIGPDKLLLIAPDESPATLPALVAAVPRGLHAQTSNPTYLEITRADVDKASALRELCRVQGIPAEAVVAIGDGMNDLGMLTFAGTAVATANARPEVIAAAHFVTSTNDEDGVARALDALFADGRPPRSG